MISTIDKRHSELTINLVLGRVSSRSSSKDALLKYPVHQPRLWHFLSIPFTPYSFLLAISSCNPLQLSSVYIVAILSHIITLFIMHA